MILSFIWVWQVFGWHSLQKYERVSMFCQLTPFKLLDRSYTAGVLAIRSPSFFNDLSGSIIRKKAHQNTSKYRNWVVIYPEWPIISETNPSFVQYPYNIYSALSTIRLLSQGMFCLHTFGWFFHSLIMWVRRYPYCLGSLSFRWFRPLLAHILQLIPG